MAPTCCITTLDFNMKTIGHLCILGYVAFCIYATVVITFEKLTGIHVINILLP
jgi:hypothetical protein